MKQQNIKSIRKSALFAGIKAEEFNLIIESLDSQLKNYRRNQVILTAGTKVRRIGLIMEGSITIYQDDFWGNHNEIDHKNQGELFAEAFACDRKLLSNIMVVASQPSIILWFDIMDILKIDTSDVNRTALIRNIMNAMAKKNLELNNKLTFLSCRTTREKLLAYLSECSLQAGSNEFDIPYDRQELADYLKVERSAMSFELGKLVKAGYLETNRHHFILKKKKD